MLAALTPSCGSEVEEQTSVEAEPPFVEDESGAATIAVRAAPPPQHEGTVVLVDDVPVEIVAHESGQVRAWFIGEDVPVEDRVELTVSVPTSQRRTGRPVRLTYVPAQARWEGRVRRLEIVPGPVDVELVLDGESLRGHVDVIVVAPVIEVHVTERAPAVEVVEVRRGKHRKQKRRRRGRGHGRGVQIRF